MHVPPSDDRTLFPTDGNIVSNHQDPRLSETFAPELLGG